MADWLKGIGPLGHLPLGRSKGSNILTRVGLEITTQLGKSSRNRQARKRMEEHGEYERRRQDDLLQNPPPVHGSARWANAAEIRDAGYLRGEDEFDHKSSILLGALVDDNEHVDGWLHWGGDRQNEEGHLLTVAPTRSGKSTMLIVPNLLRYRGSAVVLDPKGELFDLTSAWRAKNVGPVYRIDPFGSGTHGFNPLSTIQDQADARALADLLLQDDKRSSEYFKKDAVSFLTALILYVINRAPDDRKTIAEIRRMSSVPLRQFSYILEAMLKSDIPAVRNAAGVVGAKSVDRGLAVLRDTLNADLTVFDDPGVSAATATADVDFRTLKDSPATVYITVPFDKMDAFAVFLKVALTSALNAMVQNKRRPEIPVLFVVDEFLMLGKFEKFQNALMTHAGAGVRLWFFLQNLAKLEQHYPDSWKSFFDATVKVFFGTDEPFTGKLISEFLGDTTVAYRSSSLSASISRNAGDDWTAQDPTENLTLNTTVNVTGRALLTPEQVMRLLATKRANGTRSSIITIPGVPPVKGRLVPYFIGQRAKARLGAAKLFE